MKLITFQNYDVLNTLKRKGILVADSSRIDLQKYAIPYDWIVQQMKNKNICPLQQKYPLWAWAKCGGFHCPKKRKNYFNIKQNLVKITFEKKDDEVLLSDYMAYSFILSGHIIPRTKEEYISFLNTLKNKNISLEELKNFIRNKNVSAAVKTLFPSIQKTWQRMFDLKSNVHQACVWDIKEGDILKIEILNDPHYLYGTMNAKRPDGSGPDWKKKYLDFL